MRAELVVEILGVLKYMLEPPAARRPHPWLSAQDMCKKAKIAPARLQQLRESGCISYLYLEGEHYYYSKDVIKRSNGEG